MSGSWLVRPRRAALVLALVALMLCPALAQAATQRVQLATGEVLNVQIISVDDETIRFTHPVLGELSLPRSKVTILADDGATTGDTGTSGTSGTSGGAATSQPIEPTAPDQSHIVPPESPAPPPPPPVWTFKLTIAGAYATGTSDNANVAAAFAGKHETPSAKTIFDLGYFYNESNHERSDNRATAGARNDWLNPGMRWFVFADARYDYDEFQSWEQRISAHVGPGYHFLYAPPLRLDGLMGIGLVKEFGSDNDDVRPELQLGFDGEWKISHKQALTFSTFYYPDLINLGEFRWTNAAEWTCLLDEKTRLSLTAGLKAEYQSQVEAGNEHNDLRVYAGLQLEF